MIEQIEDINGIYYCMEKESWRVFNPSNQTYIKMYPMLNEINGIEYDYGKGKQVRHSMGAKEYDFFVKQLFEMFYYDYDFLQSMQLEKSIQKED